MKTEETLFQMVERTLKTMRGFTESNTVLMPEAVLAFLDNVERLIKEQQVTIQQLKSKDTHGSFDLPPCDSYSTADGLSADSVTMDQLLNLLGRWQSIGVMLTKTNTTDHHRHILADTNAIIEKYASGMIVSNACDKCGSEANHCSANKNTMTLEEIIESAKSSEQGDEFQAAFDRASSAMEIGSRVRKLKYTFPHLHAAVMSILDHNTSPFGGIGIDDIRVGWTNIGTVKNMVAAQLESDDVETRETAQVVNGLLQVIYNLSAK